MATVASGARRRGSGRMNANSARGLQTANVRRNGAGAFQQTLPTGDGVYGNEKMVHGLMNMLGYTVVVTVKNGSQYEGILSTVSPKMDIHLSLGHLVQQGANGQITGPLNRDDVIKSMIFKASDIVSFCASNVDYDMTTRDNFTDGAINRNGQSVERDMRELEPWIAEAGEEDNLALESGTNGWDAHDMFKRNAEQFDVKSTYDENLTQYTTPLVRKNDKDYRLKEEEAERIAREIESTDTYRAHSALENGDRDEEDKFSAVVRPEEHDPPNTGRYIPPNRRNQMSAGGYSNHPSQHRGQLGHMPTPLPQREKRERDRGWENQGSRQSGQAHGGSNLVSVQTAHGNSSNVGPQRKDLADVRMNGGDMRERKSAMEVARSFQSKPMGSMASSPSQQRQHPVPAVPAQVQVTPPAAVVQPQLQQAQNPAQHQPAQPSQAPVATSVSTSVPAASAQSPTGAASEKTESRDLSPHSQMQAQGGQSDRKSRDKEKVEDLKRFGKIFKLPPDEEVEGHKTEPAQEEKRVESEEKKEDEKTEVKVNENVIKSSLNPMAKEFKPSFTQAVKTVPAPSPTPPRQSPVVHPPPMVPPNVYPSNYTFKMVPITTHQQNVPQRHPKRAVVSVHPDPALAAHHATGQPLLAAQTASMPTQQFVYQVPQTVLPQGAAPPFQMMATRVVPPTSMQMSHQGGGVDPTQASSQTQHAAQQIFVAQPGPTPIPAHMTPHPGAGALSHPQPAHTHMQHHQQHQHQHQHQQHQQHHPVPVPPVPQSQSGQITPHPSASPVQHMGPNGHNPAGPQAHHGHTQGAPPTSGTPQPSLSYGQQMGMQGHPPMQPAHTHPAHTHAGHNNPNPQALHPVSLGYMPHTLQHGSLSQAGGSGGGGGPAPAHVQHSTHTPMGQPHVVVMPQPPPHNVNQAISSHHHHHHGSHQYHQQHVTVTAGPSQVHSGAGQGPHLLPGNMHTAIPVSGTGIAGMHPGQLHHAPFVPPNSAQYKHVNHQGGHFQAQ